MFVYREMMSSDTKSVFAGRGGRSSSLFRKLIVSLMSEGMDDSSCCR